MLFALCLGYASTHFIDVLCLCNHFSGDITPYSVDLSILAIGYQRHHSTQYHGTPFTLHSTQGGKPIYVLSLYPSCSIFDYLKKLCTCMTQHNGGF